jgi:drug/metabolite transporter (DMT)-like permease
MRPSAGLGLAIVSAAAFGTSGTFATALIGSGWTPTAAVTARITIAALALTIPAVLSMRGQWSTLLRTARSIGVYGLIAVAGSQLCYFNAVQHLSVGVALLLEYLGTLLVVGWLWFAHGQRPRRLTIAGAVCAVVGLALVLDLSGHQQVDPIGVLWGLGAAVGLAVYFVLSSETEDAVPPIAMSWAAIVVGAACLIIFDCTGILPFHAGTGQVELLHHRTSWLVPVLELSLVAAVLAYVTGIDAARSLGAKLSSFVGLSEVLFAVLFAWILLGQLPRGIQLLGGVFILAGVALVRADEFSTATAAETVPIPA